jgi:hypothetical protein
MEENPEANANSEDQPPETTNNDPNSHELPLELPEIMDLDGNDEKDEKEEDLNEENPPEDENIELPNEENADNDEQIDENELPDSSKQQINEIPDNLLDQEQEQLEQSALTQDKTANQDSSLFNQPNDLQKSLANAETFEEEKNANMKILVNHHHQQKLLKHNKFHLINKIN